VRAIGGADQLRREADLITRLAYAALENVRDIELLANDPEVLVPVLELKR
jgi:hypothetical protein